MNPAPPAIGSVERFAETVAALTRPFAVRDAVLRLAVRHMAHDQAIAEGRA